MRRLGARPVPPGPRRRDPALTGLADAAAAATADFAAFLRDDLLPLARTRDAAGRELHEVTSAAFLGERIDLDETYAWGWSELAALTDGCALDADPAGVIDGVPALEAWLQQRVDETMAAVAGTHFDVPDRTRRGSAA